MLFCIVDDDEERRIDEGIEPAEGGDTGVDGSSLEEVEEENVDEVGMSGGGSAVNERHKAAAVIADADADAAAAADADIDIGVVVGKEHSCIGNVRTRLFVSLFKQRVGSECVDEVGKKLPRVRVGEG